MRPPAKVAVYMVKKCQVRVCELAQGIWKSLGKRNFVEKMRRQEKEGEIFQEVN
jgi:hypothetical protein